MSTRYFAFYFSANSSGLTVHQCLFRAAIYFFANALASRNRVCFTRLKVCLHMVKLSAAASLPGHFANHQGFGSSVRSGRPDKGPNNVCTQYVIRMGISYTSTALSNVSVHSPTSIRGVLLDRGPDRSYFFFSPQPYSPASCCKLQSIITYRLCQGKPQKLECTPLGFRVYPSSI